MEIIALVMIPLGILAFVIGEYFHREESKRLKRERDQWKRLVQLQRKEKQ